MDDNAARRMGFAEIGQRLVYIQQWRSSDVGACGAFGMGLVVRTRFDRHIRTDASSVTGDVLVFNAGDRIDLSSG